MNNFKFGRGIKAKPPYYNIMDGIGERRVFTIPVGHIPQNEIENYIRRMSDEFRRIPVNIINPIPSYDIWFPTLNPTELISYAESLPLPNLYYSIILEHKTTTLWQTFVAYVGTTISRWRMYMRTIYVLCLHWKWRNR